MYNLTDDYYDQTKWISEQLEEQFGELDEYGLENTVHEISSSAYDGFIPHTNGGRHISILQLLSSSYEASGAHRDIIEPYAEQSRKDAAEYFIEQHDTLKWLYAEHVDETSAADEKTPADWLYERWSDAEELHELQPDLYNELQFWESVEGREREDFYEYEHEFLSEGGEYFLQCTVLYYAANHRRNLTGKDEVYIFAGVNTDFTYGRERGLETTFERTYALDRLTEDRIRVIIEAAADSINKEAA